MPDPATRREFEKLLPFYAAGSLEADDRNRVDAALEEDPELRDELAFLRELRQTVKQVNQVPEQDDLGWARVRRRLRAEARRERLSAAWRPALAIAAALALLVQSTVLVQWSEERDSTRLAAGPAAHLQVVLAPDATEAAIRETLRSVGGSIVEGPSALGVYRLRIDPEPETPDEWRAVLAELESRPDVVHFVAQE